MSYLLEALLRKERELNNLIPLLKQDLQDVPDGQLRISHTGSVPQYYYRSEKTDGPFKNGKYIKKENIQLAYALAQRDYDNKLLQRAEKRLKSVQSLLKDFEVQELSNVYERMNSCRKELITPKVISDEMFIKQWENVEFQGNPFSYGNSEIYTEKGERVRSKSEKIIADMLYRQDVPYRYEYPIHLNGIGTVYPDFTILNIRKRQEMYWEHLGMMDNAEYCEHALHKLNCYIKNGINFGDGLIISYETSKRPLETAVIEKIVRANCF